MNTRLSALGVSLLAACGGTGSMEADPELQPDAGVGTMADAAVNTDGAPTAKGCSIRTRRAGVTAVLHDADGSVRAVTTTDASGVASWSDCPTNAMISYAFLAKAGWQGVTVAAIKPGSDIEVVVSGADPVTTAKVDIPTDNADITMIRALAGGSCWKSGAEGATAQIAVNADCVADSSSTLPVLVSGMIGSAHVYTHGSATMTVGGDTIVNNLGTWMTGNYLSVSATDAPDSDMFFTVQTLRNGRGYGGYMQLAYVMSDGTSSSNVSVAPSAFSTTWRIGVMTGQQARRGIQRMTTQLGDTFDMGALLPEIPYIIVSNATPSRPAYTVGGALTAADVGVVESSWLNNGVDVDWRLLYPAATTTTITFPELPAELAAMTPVAAIVTRGGVFDITGSSYTEILEGGYQFGEFHDYCGRLQPGAECSFTSRYP